MNDIGAALEAIAAPLFVTIDGGLFDDLPSYFRTHGVVARSLFQFPSGSDEERHGVWLVDQSQQSASAWNAVVALCDTRRAGVYWICDVGEAELHKHLRSLNVVRLPSGKTVFFRHADPMVALSVVRVLEADQVPAFFGPAMGIYVFNKSFTADMIEHGGAVGDG